MIVSSSFANVQTYLFHVSGSARVDGLKSAIHVFDQRLGLGRFRENCERSITKVYHNVDVLTKRELFSSFLDSKPSKIRFRGYNVIPETREVDAKIHIVVMSIFGIFCLRATTWF